MQIIKATRTTRIYKHPEYNATDPGTVVNAGYLLIYRRIISHHRLSILKLELIDDSVACIYEHDWREVNEDAAYCDPSALPPNFPPRSNYIEESRPITYRAARPTRLRVNASSDVGSMEIKFGEMIKIVEVVYSDEHGISDCRLIHNGAEFHAYVQLGDYERLAKDGSWVAVEL